MSQLFVFGQSMGLPFNIKNSRDGWPSLLAEHLGLSAVINRANSASDNFLIYHCYRESLLDIRPDDLVVIAWSHPSRKVFVRDKENLAQNTVVEKSIVYNINSKEFIRSSNPIQDSITKFLSLKPLSKGGVDYYDTWFADYYSDYEQRLNFQSYLDSAAFTCPCEYIPFFFSKESVEGINAQGAGHMVDFIVENNCAISSDDCHLNEFGHKLWAEHLASFYRDSKKRQLHC